MYIKKKFHLQIIQILLVEKNFVYFVNVIASAYGI